MEKRTNIPLTDEVVQSMDVRAEYIFACAVKGKANLVVEYQIPVGIKKIDFKVVNTRVGGQGKLVEVSNCTEGQIKRLPKKVAQNAAMVESGIPHVTLHRTNIKNIFKHLK